MTYFLGIDVGTSSLKAGLWHLDGHLASQATHTYPTQRPFANWAEQNPLDWWEALRITLQRILVESNVKPSEIKGIGIDSTGWTFIPIDKDGNPLYSAIIWQDRRATIEAKALQSHPDVDRIIRLCANPLDEGYATAKINWLRIHEAELYRETEYFLMSSSFLVYKLTGAFTCDYTQAYALHCFDIRNSTWDETTADALGIDLAKLAPLVQSCDIVGEVTPEAAADLELVPGIPVIAGGVDAAVGAFGSGIARVGITADQGGTAFGLSIAVDRVIVEPRLIFSPHVVPGLYLLQGGTVGGGTFDWFRKQFGHTEEIAAELLGESVYSIMTTQARKSPPGANGLLFLPYMSGERSPIWNSNARGVFFGLNYDTKRADLIRALMEGCVFAVYHNMQIAEATGVQITEWIGIGGASNSADWCQLKADITNRPFTVTRRITGEPGDNTLGLAIMVGYGTGYYNDLTETVERFLPQRQTYQPDPAKHMTYEQLFPVFRNIYEHLIPSFEELATFSYKYKER